MMILASVALAGSLLATDAQARGGGGGGHGGGMGGGFGGGHMAGMSGGHMGGFGGGMAGLGAGHIGGLGGGRIGVGAGHIDGVGAGGMAHADHDRLGRRRFAGRGYYGDGLGCSYYPYAAYNRPYYCDY
jgi:hypothetical protein